MENAEQSLVKYRFPQELEYIMNLAGSLTDQYVVDAGMSLKPDITKLKTVEEYFHLTREDACLLWVVWQERARIANDKQRALAKDKKHA